ncbi:MAG: type II secretion system ATPase GspE [Pseudomonadota bacterium]
MFADLIDTIGQDYDISTESLEEARRLLRNESCSAAEALLRKKIVSETQLLQSLSRRYHLSFQPTLSLDNITGAFTDQIPIQFLKRHLIVPLRRKVENTDKTDPAAAATDSDTAREASAPEWVIAINDPGSAHAIDDLTRIIGATDPEIVFSTRESILSAINISYDFSRGSAEQLVQDMEDDGAMIITDMDNPADLLDDTSDAPIIKLVNHILSESIKARASDIHFEPYQDGFKVRYRVDGILYDLLSPPKWIQQSVISRIKVMAKLNIAEKRLPQDGRIEVKVGDQEIDIRVSTLPTSFGERVVLRLLNKTASLVNVTDLGLTQSRFKQLSALVTSPNGIILVTGPTGSGKTTSLYAILSSIKTPEINIITIEDPVEYQLKGISQIQVNPKIDLTFARGLRSIVRQDPDVILVGEIRDKETADIAVQSALTGHLVFSTLHTNDSASAITRLVDIGVEPFLISSAVVAVIAQRLVRVLCHECRTVAEPDLVILAGLGITDDAIQGRTFYKPQGCDACFHSGFKGRIGIFEIMEMNSPMKSLVLKTYDANRIKEAAVKHGMTTLRQDGLDKVLQGITTLEEVLRATQK